MVGAKSSCGCESSPWKIKINTNREEKERGGSFHDWDMPIIIGSQGSILGPNEQTVSKERSGALRKKVEGTGIGCPAGRKGITIRVLPTGC